MPKEVTIPLDNLVKGIGTDGDPQQKIVQIIVDGKPVSNANVYVHSDGTEFVPVLKKGADGSLVKQSDGQPIIEEVPLGQYVNGVIKDSRVKKQ